MMKCWIVLVIPYCKSQECAWKFLKLWCSLMCCKYCLTSIYAFQVSRGGQSVTLFGTSLVIFGGQDAKRTLLNDLHILDLETLTWDEIDAV